MLKWLIISTFVSLPEFERPTSSSAIFHPFQSLAECEAHLTKELKKGERIERNSIQDLVVVSDQFLGTFYSQCVMYFEDR